MKTRKRVAIVTGGSRGIGKGIVKQLSESFHVIGTSTSEERAAQIQEEFGSKHVKYYCLDLSLSKSIEEFVKIVKERYKKVDLLVNNACTNHMVLDKDAGLFEETTYELASDIFNVNYFGTKNLTLMLLPLLLKGENGCVLTLSSQGAVMGTQNFDMELKQSYRSCKNFKQLDNLIEQYLFSLKDGSWKEKGYETRYPLPAYAFSKNGLNFFTKILAENNPKPKTQNNPDIFTVCCHPGHVKTRLTVKSRREKLSPAEAARNVLNLLKEETRSEMNGKFVMNGKVMDMFAKLEIPNFGKDPQHYNRSVIDQLCGNYKE